MKFKAGDDIWFYPPGSSGEYLHCYAYSGHIVKINEKTISVYGPNIGKFEVLPEFVSHTELKNKPIRRWSD